MIVKINEITNSNETPKISVYKQFNFNNGILHIFRKREPIGRSSAISTNK